MPRTIAALLFVSLLFAPKLATADFIMNVVASPAPNFLSSPNWNAYAANAMASLEDSLGDIGDREVDPTAYEIFLDGEVVRPEELIVSSFDSWRGEADPVAPFADENGNRLHFGLHILGDGTDQFRMEDIAFSVMSDDGGSLDFAGTLAGASYSAVRVGIDFGADRTKGTLDDVLITSGAATQFVDEFIYVGVGNAFDASSAAGVTDQEKLDNTIASIRSSAPFNVTGTYTLSDTGGSELVTGSTFIQVIPEPGSAAGLMLLGLAAFRRRRQA